MDATRLGEYEIVGAVAQGGMAEILLGRRRGPNGFERLVVIKRILPHCAKNPAFRDMFLDEARIAAGIRHRNVVQHHSLEQDGEELFLVMEYLEGEAVSGLRRRAIARQVQLEPAVCAYIVAEAAAGLHAAHELVSTDGVHQEVVHRDISPHNLFVTYDGTVKVIDFGIAKAAGRITHTETGMVKGKFGYMSPEQAMGKALDRRSDIFSLGVVLYELVSGKRLFQRTSHAATLNAVLQMAYPPLEDVAPGCPECILEITERALARRPEDRYADATEMRQALVDAITELGPTTLPQQLLEGHMETLFHERRDEKQSMLRQAETFSGTMELVPPGDVDQDVEIPEVVGTATIRDPLGTPPPIPLPERRRGRWILGPVAAVIVLAGAYVALDRPSEEASIRAVAARESIETSGAVGALAPIPNRPERPRDVEVVIETDPPGAMVEIAGERFGQTPATLRLPFDNAEKAVLLTLEGHRALHSTLVANADQALDFELEAEPEEAAPAKRTRRRPRRRPASMTQSMAEDSTGNDDWSQVRF